MEHFEEHTEHGSETIVLIEGKQIKEEELQNSKYPKNHKNLVKITSIAIYEVPKRQVIREPCMYSMLQQRKA